MVERINESEWKWYGFALHLIAGKRCAYHLGTVIGEYVISTVGAYYPPHSEKMETIGSGKDDYYETYVFELGGFDEHTNPVLKDSEVWSLRYADSLDAERGHHRVCEMVATDSLLERKG